MRGSEKKKKKEKDRQTDRHIDTVVSPGFVGRRGKARDYVMGHSRWTSEPGAAAAR